jgi:peptidyl-prolyl cis-trans isomerase D
MAASLVFFYAPTRDAIQRNLSVSGETVAKVGSDYVTVGEVVTQKENLDRMYGGRGGLSSKIILDGLIREKLLRQEAGKLGLTATDAEVAAEILEQNKNTDGKPFDQTRYERNVTEQFGSVKKYEDTIRNYLSGQKLEAFITSGVNVSEADVLNDYKKRNTKLDVSYVNVNVADLAAGITPTDEEQRNYFEQNKKNYFISSPQKKIRYVFVNTTKVGEKLVLTDEEIKAEYDKLPEDKKLAGVQGQQIVLRVLKPEFEASVQEKADKLSAEIRSKGATISEEAFAEIAKGQSEDQRTASTGGKIPGLIRANPNNPTDPYQRLVSMKPGEVTEAIKFGSNYFILRRGEGVLKPLADAKKEIEVSLRNRKAYAAAAELAQKVEASLKETKDAQKTAQEFASQANMSAKEMVRETDFVKPGDDVPNIGNSPQFEEGIAPLENVNDVGAKIPVKEGFAIPLLVDKKDPRDATFEEVKAKVLDAVKFDQARSKLEDIAKEIASGAASASALNSAAQVKGLKAKDSKNFILGSPLGEGASASTSEELEAAIGNLKVGEVTKNPVKLGDSYYIVGVIKREEADMQEFAKQRDQLIQQMQTQKRGEVFSEFIGDLRRRMEANGQIKIYKDVIEKIDGPTGAPGEDESPS